MASVRHPMFSRVYDRAFSRMMEPEVAGHRKELLSGLRGRVVEVGAGNGLNFAHYPAEVRQVIAVEPEPYLRKRAEQAAAGAPVPVSVLGGVAESLPLESGSCDAAVASLVLCSVSDPATAVNELRRVLRPAGELRFFEHVRSSRPRKARVQELADRSGIWPWFGGGCHSSRDTIAAIEAVGFEIERHTSFDVGPQWGLTNPFVLGIARAAPGA